MISIQATGAASPVALGRMSNGLSYPARWGTVSDSAGSELDRRLNGQPADVFTLGIRLWISPLPKDSDFP
jgi:hypothetical protein